MKSYWFWSVPCPPSAIPEARSIPDWLARHGTSSGTRVRPGKIRAIMLGRQERFWFVGSHTPAFVVNYYSGSHDPLWDGTRTRPTLLSGRRLALCLAFNTSWMNKLLVLGCRPAMRHPLWQHSLFYRGRRWCQIIFPGPNTLWWSHAWPGWWSLNLPTRLKWRPQSTLW